MGELVRFDQALLPREPRYRPVGKLSRIARRLPVALSLGAAVGVLTVVLHPAAMWISLAAIFGWGVYLRRRVVALAQRNDEALALLFSGELERAAAEFDALCVKARGAPRLHSMVVFNRAVVFLESGEPERAAGLLSAVLHAGWIGPAGALRSHYPLVLGRLAMAEALRGRVDEAQMWRTRAQAATSAAKRGIHLMTDVILEARRGDDEAVLALVSEGWSRAEHLLTARQLRFVRLIEAFSLERSSSGDYRGVSRQTDFVRALEAARGIEPGGHLFLTAQWPDLDAFVRRHDVA